MEAVIPTTDKEEVTLSEGESDCKEKVVMAVAKDTAITMAVKAAAIMVVAKAVAIMVAAKDMAITMEVISDSIVAHPIAIGRMC